MHDLSWRAVPTVLRSQHRKDMGRLKIHKLDQRPAAPFLHRQAERGGVVESGKEKTPGDLRDYSSTWRGYKRYVEELFIRACSGRTWGNGF